MRMRSLISLAMALLLALFAFVPASAETPSSIEAAVPARSGSFTLRLSDPKFSIVQGGETIEQDLLGLSVQLGGVRDASDLNLDNLLLSLMVLAGDDPALSAMLGLKDTQLYALVNGITGVLVMPAEQALSSIDASPVSGIARLAELIEGIQFTESAPEPVRFYASEGEYPRHSASLSNTQLRELLMGADLPKDLSCDLSYFTDGADNLRVEGTLYNLFNADKTEQANMTFELTAEGKPDGTRNAKGSANSGAMDLALTLNSAPDPAYPDHYALEAQLDVTSKDGSSQDSQLRISLFPSAAQDGVISDLLSAELTQAGQPAFQLNAVSRATEEDESYSLVLNEVQNSTQYELHYDGTIAKAASEMHTGTLRLETSGAEPVINGELKLSLSLSDSAEGKIPDISKLESVDLASLSEADQQRLMSELQQLQLTMLGKLMTLPSLARIIAKAMSGGSF